MMHLLSLPACVFASSALLSIGEADQAFHRIQLDNGIRILVAHVPEAELQTTMTFLPLSLVNDGADQAQWSHLLEHMMIRSTDPGQLIDGGIEMNGETGSGFLRLDTYATPGSLEASVEKHVQWLATREVDASTLQREKQKIGGEIDSTLTRGYTHKWALAAWNQIIRHGRDHARVRGDIDDATVEGVKDVLASRIPVDASVLIASVGPIEPHTVVAQLRGHFKDLPGHAVDRLSTPADPRRAAYGGATTGTWDVASNHLMFWWQLPDDDADTLLAARAAWKPLSMQMQIGARSVDVSALVMVESPIRTPEGAFLLVNMTCSADVFAQDLIDACLRRLALVTKETRYVRQGADDYAGELKFVDAGQLRRLREQAAAAGMARYLDGNRFLPLAMAEFTFSEPVDAIRQRAESLDDEVLQTICELLNRPPLGSLTLQPASE